MRPTRGTLILAAVILVQLLPIWLLPFFPTQDGPTHMTIARVLRDYDRPDAQVLRSVFERNGEAVPNWFVYFVMADVLRFVSVPIAEKILLSAYVILLPLAVRYAVAGVARENAASAAPASLALLALPFTFNYLLTMGFYNFSLSLVAFFVALGWWLRHRDRFGPKAALVFAVLSGWVYFCHPVTLVALLATVGVAAVWKRDLRSLAWLVLAGLPATVLTFSYAGEMGGYRGWLPFGERLWRLMTLNALVTIDSRTDLLAAPLAVALVVVAFRFLTRERRICRETGLGPAILGLFVLALAAPQAVGVGNFITDRLVLFPYMVLILWLAGFEHGSGRRLGLEIVGAGFALALLGFLVPCWHEANLYLAEMAPALERVEPGSTYLPLAFSWEGENADGGPVLHRVYPFLHAGDHVSARTAVANLNLFAAGTDAFPIRYRKERDPFTHLRTARGWVLSDQVDYVLVWWPRTSDPKILETSRLLVDLEARYDRVYTSPRDLVRLYRRHGRRHH
jgi:hypothetical protein